MFGLERAELRDGDLKIREHLQQERLKLLIRTVDLVDQQDRRLGLGADRAQQRPLEEERVAEDEALLLLRVTRGALLDLDPQHLLWIVPLVEGRVDVEAFVALQADQFSVEGCGQNFGDLGLPDPGLSLDEDWLLQLHGQERRGSDGAVRHIVLPLHHLLNTADTLDHSLLLTRGRPLVVQCHAASNSQSITTGRIGPARSAHFSARQALKRRLRAGYSGRISAVNSAGTRLVVRTSVRRQALKRRLRAGYSGRISAVSSAGTRRPADSGSPPASISSRALAPAMESSRLEP